MMTQKKRNKKISPYIWVGVVYFFAIFIYIVSSWAVRELGVNFQQLMYTLAYPLEGTDDTTVIKGFKECTGPILLTFAPYLVLAIFDYKKNIVIRIKGRILNKERDFDLSKIIRKAIALLTVVCIVLSSAIAMNSLGVFEYVKNRLDKTTIYEERYVNPENVAITASKETKNLIYIYMESLETTYASNEVGGIQSVNLIPNLTNIARKNLSFSDTNAVLGGAHPAFGTTWTMGAIFALNSGVPFSFPLDNTDMSIEGNFAKGITCLGDVLAEKGYVQEFLCGSDAVFGGRKSFFTQHGNYKIFDYFTAIEKKYIASDYHVFWGYEDNILYKIAKDELTGLSKTGKPFNLTMLTVDTHFPDGYVCDNCRETYGEIAANVVNCADRQIEDFIFWCQSQSWYEDTTIVIVGDHPRMDTKLVNNLECEQRRVYNAFINCEISENVSTKNRQFAQMDMFPTVLSAMGFNIEGNRLGLGTNLFSDEQTIIEQMGYTDFNNEIAKYSKYYVENFS